MKCFAPRNLALGIVGDGVNHPDDVALMGNFDVTNVNQDLSLITAGEWMPKNGAKGDLLAAEIRWTTHNRLTN